MNSKADIIKVLLQKKLKFKIPKTYSFTIKDWYTNSKLITGHPRKDDDPSKNTIK